MKHKFPSVDKSLKNISPSKRDFKNISPGAYFRNFTVSCNVKMSNKSNKYYYCYYYYYYYCYYYYYYYYYPTISRYSNIHSYTFVRLLFHCYNVRSFCVNNVFTCNLFQAPR